MVVNSLSTDIATLGALYQRCALVLGPDSGALHLAVAAGAPLGLSEQVVSMTGSSSSSGMMNEAESAGAGATVLAMSTSQTSATKSKT